MKKIDTLAIMAAREATLPPDGGGEKLIEAEKVEKGDVTAKTYAAYFRLIRVLSTI